MKVVEYNSSEAAAPVVLLTVPPHRLQPLAAWQGRPCRLRDGELDWGLERRSVHMFACASTCSRVCRCLKKQTRRAKKLASVSVHDARPASIPRCFRPVACCSCFHRLSKNRCSALGMSSTSRMAARAASS